MKSHRARQNMTRQMKAGWTWLQKDLQRELKGLEDAKKFCRLLRKPFAKSTSYKAYMGGIRDTKRQISALRSLILRRQKSVEIYQVF